MGFDNSSVAKEFINFIKTMIDESNKKNTFVIPAIVESENSNKTYNVYIPPDMSTVIKNIQNGSKFDIKHGDTVYIMALNGDIANSFIIYNQGGRQETSVEEDIKQESNLSFKNFSDYQYIFNLIFPIGSVYIQTGSIEPAEKFGFVWEKIEGRFLLGSDQSHSAGDVDGQETHSHTLDNGYAKACVHYDLETGNSFVLKDKSTVSYGANIRQESGRFYTYAEGQTISMNKGIDLGGSTSEGSNMPPYQVVNIWERKG